MNQGEPPGSLRNATVGALSWSALSTVTTIVLQLGSIIALSHLLRPREFGLFGLLGTANGLIAVLAELGFVAALVQRGDVTQRTLSSVHWIQVLIGATAAAVLAAGSSVVAHFYNEPQLRDLALAQAAGFLLGAWGAVPRALMMRNLAFKRLAACDVVSGLLGVCTGVSAAALGAGAWSFVLANLVAATTGSLASAVAARWWPSLVLSRADLGALVGFSGPLYLYSLINYAIRNGDNILVGRFLGAVELSFYTRGYAFLLLPSRQISAAVGRVLVVSLSRLQSDVVRLREAYVQACQAIVAISLPVMLGVAALAPEIVAVLFGPAWAGASGAIRVFALAGAFESVTTTTGWLMQARGRTSTMARMSLPFGAVWLGAIACGVWVGTALSVAVAYAVITPVLGFVLLRLACRPIGLQVWTLVTALRAEIGCATVMGGTVFGFAHVLIPNAAAWVRLVGGVALGACVHAGLCLLAHPPGFTLLLRTARGRLHRQAA